MQLELIHDYSCNVFVIWISLLYCGFDYWSINGERSNMKWWQWMFMIIGAILVLGVVLPLIYITISWIAARVNWWQGILAGLGLGIFIGTPVFFGIARLYRNTMDRRAIKEAIRKNEFLIPMDVRDYDQKLWADKITPDPKAVDGLNSKLFKRVNKERENNPITR